MKTKINKQISHWWVVASEQNPKHAWHWNEFFKNCDDSQELKWGGPDGITSSVSRARIKTMRKGDIVVAYQTGEGVVGLGYLGRDGYQSKKDGPFDSFKLKSAPNVGFNNPVPYKAVRELLRAKENIEFVRSKVKQGTVFGITKAGFASILELVLKLNSEQAAEILGFLSPDKWDGEAYVVASDGTSELKPTHRTNLHIQRIIRDSASGRNLKKLYEYKCQICRDAIELPDGKRFAEVHHLRPIGEPHNGKEGKSNTIVVCPQHHAMFDLGVIAIHPENLKVEHWKLDTTEHDADLFLLHDLHKASLAYHYKLYKARMRTKISKLD